MSKLTKFFKKDYEKSDKMLGGYLPFGVTPTEVRKQSQANAPATTPQTKKLSVFERAKVGVRTTFGIKELSPEQKADVERKRKEEQAYKQEITRLEKEAWQKVYQQEHQKQILIYAEKRQREAMARGVSKAQQEVEAMGKPKQKLAWLSAPANALAKAMPTPSPKVQQQLDFSLKVLSGGAENVFGGAKQSKKISSMGTGMWDLPIKSSNNHTGLKQLGTARGGVNVDINSNGEIILAGTGKKSRSRRVKNLKHKLKAKPQSQVGDMFWKL